MTKKIFLLFTAISLVFSCTEDDCGDTRAHSFTETELAWFSSEPGDTVTYKDALSGELYYLACVLKEMGVDTSFSTTVYCDRGVTFDIYHYINIEFASNFPHSDNNDLNIILRINTHGKFISEVFIEFFRNPSDDYRYWLVFNNQSEELERHFYFEISSGCDSLGTIFLNGKEYTNAYSISYREDVELNQYAFYDTIYYNKDGFLKFISSQYGYNLEIVE